MKNVKTTKRQALFRGLRKRCPHCGGGPLFKRWIVMHERCSVCQMKLLLNSGDPWAFLLFIDRGAFVFPFVIALYFGVYKASFPLYAGFTVAMIVGFLLTAPQRYGLCVALDYLTRVHWGDPSDVLPELPSAAAHGPDALKVTSLTESLTESLPEVKDS